MNTRIVPTIVLLAIGTLPALATDRQAEAKRYAADLKSKNAGVRATALVELGKLGQLQRRLTVPYVADITNALTDRDAKVRGEAAKTLGLVDPEDKKEAIEKIVDLFKSEKSAVAREGQATGLGELGATAEEADLKRMAREALQQARRKADNKREQKVIQAALTMINGPKKN